MGLKCPFCGGTTGEIPIIASRKRQQIFAYIWNNPNCTSDEIRKALYGNLVRCRNVVSVHITRISVALHHTEYALVRSSIPPVDPTKRGGCRYRYKIVRKTGVAPKKEIANGTTVLPTSLP